MSEGVHEATSQGRQVAEVQGEEVVPSRGGALAVYGVRSIAGEPEAQESLSPVSPPHSLTGPQWFLPRGTRQAARRRGSGAGV